MAMNVPGYESLQAVLNRAYDHAARTKGAERHANNLPFHEQPMQTIAAEHGVGFLLGQVAKKMREAQGMLNRGETAKAVHELLGAINYTAGAVIFIEGKPAAEGKADTPSFKVGDKVRIASTVDKKLYKECLGFDGDMEEHFGCAGVIMKTDTDNATAFVRVDDDAWWWRTQDLTPVALESQVKTDETGECDCPACIIRRTLGTEVVEIMISQDGKDSGGDDPLAPLEALIESIFKKP